MPVVEHPVMTLPPVNPALLTTHELLRYAQLHGPEDMPAEWVSALIRRLENALEEISPTEDCF